MDRCDDCGFVYADHDAASEADEIAGLGPRYGALLTVPAEPAAARRLRTRPGPDVWSPVEYACHVRDVLLAQRERLLQALVEEEPGFVPIYRDRRPKLAGYGDELPEQVAAEIGFAAGLVARVFGRLDPAAWRRTCVYNFPEPSVRTLLWLAQHTLHEGEHHLLDIERITGPDPA